MNSTIDHPNPDTPLAWLDPSLASQLEASRYLYMATLGAWIWDFFMSLPEEYKLVLKNRVTIAQVAYILARVSSFGFVLTSTLFQVAAIGSCSGVQLVLAWFFVVAVPSNSLLFFFRVRAVFNFNKYAVAFFGFIWLSTLASLSVPFSIGGVHIGNTNRCINSNIKPYSSVGIIVSTVNDTLVFFAITYRLIRYNTATGGTWKKTLRSFFSGEGMGGVSKALLQTGQLYYLVTVGVNILTMAMILSPTVPAVVHAMFTVPNVALENAMACRVFRKLKLGLIKEHPALSTASHSLPLRSDRSGGSRNQGQGGGQDTGYELDTIATVHNGRRTKPLTVNITHQVHVECDESSLEETKKRLDSNV